MATSAMPRSASEPPMRQPRPPTMRPHRTPIRNKRTSATADETRTAVRGVERTRYGRTTGSVGRMTEKPGASPLDQVAALQADGLGMRVPQHREDEPSEPRAFVGRHHAGDLGVDLVRDRRHRGVLVGRRPGVADDARDPPALEQPHEDDHDAVDDSPGDVAPEHAHEELATVEMRPRRDGSRP